MATNGALLYLNVGNAGPGDTVEMPNPGAIEYRATLRANFPVDHLELIWNGAVVARLNTGPDRRAADVRGTIPGPSSGWLLLRAWNDEPDADLMDVVPLRDHEPHLRACQGSATPLTRCGHVFSALARSDSGRYQTKHELSDSGRA